MRTLLRDPLWATIAAARAVLEEPGVLVVGSEVLNLLEPDAASTLVVSEGLDIGVPVDRHAAVKRRLRGFRAAAPAVSVAHVGPGVGLSAAAGVANLASAREVPVSLSGDLLSAECLVLVPFEADGITE